LLIVPLLAWTCGSSEHVSGKEDGDGAAGDSAQGGAGGSSATGGANTGGAGASAGTSTGGGEPGGAAGEPATGGGGTSGATGGANTGGSAGMSGTGGTGNCPVCSGIPDCSGEPVTSLSGRVITPGRDDLDTGNQVGVPNALVYLLRTSDASDLPAIPEGIPVGAERCDRCEDQMLGPVLAGAVTDATGAFTIEEQVPVGVEVVLVVKAGRFRRATTLTLPFDAACRNTMLPAVLPDNPTRLPRDTTDGLAVHIPRIAVQTGQNEAFECVLEKMGLAHALFTNPGVAGRIHLFRGGSPSTSTPPGSGARIDDMTPHANTLYGNDSALAGYDLVVADCEGNAHDDDFTERDAMGGNVREFVNGGGRFLATHLSYTWLHENGGVPYDAANPIATGLGPAAMWTTSPDQSNIGIGIVSVGRPDASPRIQNFADWTVREGITTAPSYDFELIEPRSQVTYLGDASEEFVVRTDGEARVQLFAFNTPYGAPEAAACGRVAFSGFHLAATSIGEPYANSIFPEHCLGFLTSQERILVYMFFHLDACLGDVSSALP
jgi:hypothetical protein